MNTHPSPLRMRIFMIFQFFSFFQNFFLFGCKEFLEESAPSPNFKNDEIKLLSQVTEICACVFVINSCEIWRGGGNKKK